MKKMPRPWEGPSLHLSGPLARRRAETESGAVEQSQKGSDLVLRDVESNPGHAGIEEA